MWQDVVSFDTNWLIEQELYNPEEKVLNEPKIMNAVRAAMKEQLNREDLPIVPFGQRQFITMSYTIFTFILRLLNQIQLVSTKHFQTKMVQPIKQDVAVVQKALIVFVVKLPVNYLIVMNHWPEFPR